MHFKAGQIPYYPEGKEDNTHLSVKGATEISKLAINQIRILDNPLVENLKKAIKN